MNKYNLSDKDLYTLAVIKYRKLNNNKSLDDLFSIKWNTSNDYKLKTIILAEAMSKNIKVEDTELYKDNFIGCIKEYTR